MCMEAPTAQACWRDAQSFERGLVFAGIIGNAEHQLRVSGHNCQFTVGGNESAINGVDYNPEYSHALDINHGSDRAKATRMREALLPDPRIRYILDNFVGYYPPHRGGGTFSCDDHVDHLHVSFMPGSTFDVSPYFGVNRLPPIKWPLRPDDHNLGVMFLEVALVHAGFGEIVVDGSLGPKTLDRTHQMLGFLKRKARPKAVIRGDVEAITAWSKLAGTKREDFILTLGDGGPRVHELRTNLRKLRQNVDPTGQYDLDLAQAVRNVQTFFDAPVKSGNASHEDRVLIRTLAEKA